MLTFVGIPVRRPARADFELQEETGTSSWARTRQVLREVPKEDTTGGEDLVDGGLAAMKDSASTEHEIAKTEGARPPTSIERRRHTRHRLGQPIQVWLEDGRGYPGMAFEMSESGMCAATTSDLRVGDKGDLSPVATYRVSAIVRRKTGSMYGFEFVELTEKQQKRHPRLDYIAFYFRRRSCRVCLKTRVARATSSRCRGPLLRPALHPREGMVENPSE